MLLKLEYFDLKAVAELARLIFAYADEKYEDVRVSSESWPAKKPSTPLGQMPVLVLENGEEFAQSVAISRYLAHKFGIAGKTAEEKLLCDMVVDTVKVDIWKLVVDVYLEKDESVKAQKIVEATPKIEQFMQKLEKYVRGTDTVLASGFSWADLALFNAVNDLFPVVKIQLDPGLKKLHAVVKRARTEPKIAAWLAERPDTVI